MAYAGTTVGSIQQVLDFSWVAPTGREKAPGRTGRLCLGCGERRARFSYRGVVKADRHHTLCFECYRAELQRARSRRLVNGATDPAVYRDLDRRRRQAVMTARRALRLADQAAQVDRPSPGSLAIAV